MTGTDIMQLREKDFEAVGEYVQEHLEEWMKKTETGQAAAALRERDIAVRESLARLEAELKGQREILTQNMTFMEKRFEQVDKRFEQVDKRFEQMDKRFEEMLHYMDKRFESVEKRLISLEISLRRFIYSSFSFTAAAAGVIIAVMKLT